MRAEEELAQATSRPTQERRLHSAILRDAADFRSLREEWDGLYRDCPSATPFSSWEWLYSWWEAYEEGYELRLVTLRDADSRVLAGLLPLMARRGRILLLGGDRMTLYNPISPYKDVLVREGWEEEVAEAGARALKKMRGWHVADLQELMPHSAAWGLFREWDGPKTSVPITDYLLMEARPWEEVLASLSRRLRKTARRTLRQAERDGIICQPADAEDAERAASTLVKLHRELWRGRRIDPEDLTPRYEAFIRAAARRTTEGGIGGISEFRRQEDGEVLVSQFLLFDKDFVGAYVIGATEEASGRYQLETLTNWDAIEVANCRSSKRVSSMFHASWDKLRWADEVVKSHRVILGRGRAFWVAYAGCHVLRERYHALRSVAQVYVHSEGAPGWVKRATEGYYALVLYPYSEGAPGWVKKATQGYYALRREYGYYALRYKYELAQARREIRKRNASHATTQR